MMPLVLTNLLSALAIGVVIGAMASVKSPRLRAFIYSLPIPVTVTLIATKAPVNSLSIVGIIFVTLFLWGVMFLYRKFSWPILLADILAAAAYVGLAYVFATYVTIPFWLAAASFAAIWMLTAMWVQTLDLREAKVSPASVPIIIKLLIVFWLSFGLFSAKSYLAALVVTFPYSGVFAVWENRANLQSLAIIFTRNSIAIWSLFVMYYLSKDHFGMTISILFGWLAYGIVLTLVSRFIQFKVTTLQAEEVI